MSIFIPGDSLPIEYNLYGEIIMDTSTITHFDGKYLYTCGHCFGCNATTKYGKLIETSGFDTPNESKERAIIEIYERKKELFRIPDKLVPDGTNLCSPEGLRVYMIYQRLKYFGTIVKNAELKNPITKLEKPYYLVKEDIQSHGGMSGAPWYYGDILLGEHIGRSESTSCDNIAYVKPITLYTPIKF